MNNIKETIQNRFDLILIAAKRARKIQISEKEILSTKSYCKHKCTVIALKEIENNLKNQ